MEFLKSSYLFLFSPSFVIFTTRNSRDIFIFLLKNSRRKRMEKKKVRKVNKNPILWLIQVGKESLSRNNKMCVTYKQNNILCRWNTTLKTMENVLINHIFCFMGRRESGFQLTNFSKTYKLY